MTIKEVEEVLEIPRATIRFYEKEGLITPNRGKNRYRDYSDEDVEKLKKIVILRKIEMSVEDINDIFDGAKSINEVLDENINYFCGSIVNISQCVWYPIVVCLGITFPMK